jgi:hypothetical protein
MQNETIGPTGLRKIFSVLKKRGGRAAGMAFEGAIERGLRVEARFESDSEERQVLVLPFLHEPDKFFHPVPVDQSPEGFAPAAEYFGHGIAVHT